MRVCSNWPQPFRPRVRHVRVGCDKSRYFAAGSEGQTFHPHGPSIRQLPFEAVRQKFAGTGDYALHQFFWITRTVFTAHRIESDEILKAGILEYHFLRE